jgi:hypothetical protein
VRQVIPGFGRLLALMMGENVASFIHAVTAL